MNNKLIWRGLAGSVLVCSLSACSTIKSWFPDKERDYQFTSEIPELIVPEDLKHKNMASLSRPAPASPAAETQTSADAVTTEVHAAPIESSTTESKSSAPTDQTATETQTAASIANGASSLQIDQAKVPATRLVGRALTRQKLEVTERNVDKGFFYVKFDPDAAKVSDDGFFDELNFMFGDDPSQEQEYRITVHGLSPQMSEVIIADNEGKLLSTPAANALLKLITEGINQVESQDSKTDVPATDDEVKNDANAEVRPASEQKLPEPNVPAAEASEPAK
jgi:outer membrane protein assembly factor BamC